MKINITVFVIELKPSCSVFVMSVLDMLPVRLLKSFEDSFLNFPLACFKYSPTICTRKSQKVEKYEQKGVEIASIRHKETSFPNILPTFFALFFGRKERKMNFTKNLH